MLNADVCSDFPLNAMLEAHRRQRPPFLLLGTTVRGQGEVGVNAIWSGFWDTGARQGGVVLAVEAGRVALAGRQKGVAGEPSASAALELRGGGQLSVLSPTEPCQWLRCGERQNRQNLAALERVGHSLHRVCLSG